ncbi:hypothetical protein ABI59_21705 [Acidobacteria bacterium Mor1]|nr:hypothetical protein ABI59_21705 [Acidobacteria bacterium Mor1]
MAPDACDHCGLPVPAGLYDAEAEHQFCCAGCRAVYETIRGFGLDRYYSLRGDEEAGLQANPDGGSFATFDHDAFQQRHVEELPGNLRRIELQLEGMHCAACIWLIEHTPRVVDGINSIQVDFGRKRAQVVWDPSRVGLSRIAETLDSLGYTPRPYVGSPLDEIRRRESRRLLVRMAVAGALAANVMLMSFALFAGMFDRMEAEYRELFRWSGLGLTLLAVIWPGRTFFAGARASIRTGVMHMDLPVALALAAGTIWGAVNTVRGAGETYFESLTAVIFLLLVGRYVMQRQQHAAHDAVALLYGLTPGVVHRVQRNGSLEDVPVEALESGDRVEVLPGESIPGDGEVQDGRSSLDLSLLSGESEPVNVEPGDRVFAGTTNLGSPLRIRVDSTGAETRVGRLMNLVESFARDRPRVVRLADRVAHRFVLVVLSVAAATLLGWWWVDPDAAVENAIALLIVTCPCALGLATPLALVAAIGRAARKGILIKGGEAIETLARHGRLLLDKTGTLTEGRTELIELHGDRDTIRYAAALELGVAHPIAHAFVEAGRERAGAPVACSGIRYAPGEGVAGRCEGREVRIGSATFTAPDGLPSRAAGWERDVIASGLSPVCIAVDGEVVSVAGIGDPLRADAAGALEALRERGFDLGMISGDDPRVARAIGRTLGLEDEAVHGRVAPEDKARHVQALRRDEGSLIMVGDGVNDTAALSAADVGVAVQGGAEASLSAADVYLSRPGLAPLVELIDGSRRAMGVVRRNMAASLAYNLVTGGLAVAGLINPLIAAVLMPISSLTVVTLSYRSRTF